MRIFELRVSPEVDRQLAFLEEPRAHTIAAGGVFEMIPSCARVIPVVSHLGLVGNAVSELERTAREPLVVGRRIFVLRSATRMSRKVLHLELAAVRGLVGVNLKLEVVDRRSA